MKIAQKQLREGNVTEIKAEQQLYSKKSPLSVQNVILEPQTINNYWTTLSKIS